MFTTWGVAVMFKKQEVACNLKKKPQVFQYNVSNGFWDIKCFLNKKLMSTPTGADMEQE